MLEAKSAPRLITPGVIAADLDVALHRVLHVLRTRRHIRPAARAGTLRLYDRAAVAAVHDELATIEARRGRRSIAENEGAPV
ncbi:MAG: hypothetical protein IH983_08020 [Planctomycetes bacterium]|nr:hypothetical protein [Planctomycetota bacterium]